MAPVHQVDERSSTLETLRAEGRQSLYSARKTCHGWVGRDLSIAAVARRWHGCVTLRDYGYDRKHKGMRDYESQVLEQEMKA